MYFRRLGVALELSLFKASTLSSRCVQNTSFLLCSTGSSALRSTLDNSDQPPNKRPKKLNVGRGAVIILRRSVFVATCVLSHPSSAFDFTPLLFLLLYGYRARRFGPGSGATPPRSRPGSHSPPRRSNTFIRGQVAGLHAVCFVKPCSHVVVFFRTLLLQGIGCSRKWSSTHEASRPRQMLHSCLKVMRALRASN